ncbi:MAG: hypothetical protein PHC51_08285 [bacterium]|nr:hypothetical protein [bacterium]
MKIENKANDENPGLAADSKLEVRKSILNGKHYVVQVKYTAPQAAFSYIDALTHFGNFPSLENFIEEKFVSLIDNYCSEARARLTAAAKADFLPAKQRKPRTPRESPPKKQLSQT